MKRLFWNYCLAAAGTAGGGLVGDGLGRITEVHPWLMVAGAVVGLFAGWYAGGWVADELDKLDSEQPSQRR